MEMLQSRMLSIIHTTSTRRVSAYPISVCHPTEAVDDANFLQIHHTGQGLDPIQQQITLLNQIAILRIGGIRPTRPDYAAVLVNLGGQPTGRNVTAAVVVEKVHTDTHGIGHGGQLDTAV
jgi:hypothetical protein